MNFDGYFYRGRVALYGALHTLGVGHGDKVAHQAYTCLAVPEAVLATGAEPRFVDIAPGSVNMCADDLKSKMSPDVKAIVVQHTFGIPADLGPIMAVADEYSVPVIEDCCHSFSSTYHGERVGTFGIAAFYSFEWGKPVVCGIGGGLVGNDAFFKTAISEFELGLNHPPRNRVWRVEAQFAAFRLLYRPATYWKVKQAFNRLSRSGVAVGNYNFDPGPSPDFGWRMSKRHRRRLANIDDAIKAHEATSTRLAGYYRSLAGHTGVIQMIEHPAECEVVYSRFPVWAHNKTELLSLARKHDVELADWYKSPVHPLDGAAEQEIGYISGNCPNAELAAKHVVSFPIDKRVDRSRMAALLPTSSKAG